MLASTFLLQGDSSGWISHVVCDGLAVNEEMTEYPIKAVKRWYRS